MTNKMLNFKRIGMIKNLNTDKKEYIRKGRELVIFLFLLLIPAISFSQQSQTLYYLDVPQSRLFNPAMEGLCRGYVGFPGINSVYTGLNNNFIQMEDVIFSGSNEYSDSLITPLHPSYDIDIFLDKLKDLNRLSPEVYESILSFGFTAGDNYFFLDIADRLDANVSIPKDMFTLALKGNVDFLNSSVDLSDLNLGASWYREFGFGFSREVSGNLRIGAKAKILFGIANVSIKNNGLNLQIDESNLFSHTLNADLSINVSRNIDFYRDPETGTIDSMYMEEPDLLPLIINFSNPGFGIDIGAVYNINKQFSVSASIVDLGYILWKEQSSNLNVKGSYEFEGLNISSMLVVNDSSSMDDVLDELLDTLLVTFDPADSHDAYKTYTPAKVYIGANYKVHDNISFGLLSKTQIEKGKLWESLTFSANLRAGKALTTSFSYSLTNSIYNNIGVGLSLRGGPFQFYFVTDKIYYKLSRLRMDIENSSDIIIPSNFDSFNFRFGFNIIFGCKSKRPKDRPMIN